MSAASEGSSYGEERPTVSALGVKYEQGEDDEQQQGQQQQTQLLVAMQPGVEIPAIGVEEVVVVTEGDTDGVIGQVELETTIDESADHTMGALSIAEETVEDVKPLGGKRRSAQHNQEAYTADETGSYARRSMVYERQGIQASKGPPPESSGESESEDDSSEQTTMYRLTPTKKEPKKREFAYRLQWRGKDMLDAMRAVEDKQMTIRGAAKKFMVPYSTLKDRVHGRVRHGTKPGVKTALSPEEEEELVRYIKDMEAAGFSMRNADLRERAGELLRLNYGHSSPYGEGSSPGHNWLSGFLKRHQGIEFRRQSARSVVPSCSRQRQFVKKFFDVTGQVYKKNRVSNRPERIYVVSEMKMAVFQKATIIYSASASGLAVPPFVIFKGAQKLKLTSAREAYPQAFFTSSPQGVVTEEIFLWWFRDHFLKAIPQSGNRPLVLFISQPCHNISLQMYQLAKEERVIFISIPRGVAHLLQPLDDELGDYIESCLSKKAKKWESVNSNSMFNQKVLAQLLQKVWRKVFTPEEITTKYSKVGIYPFNTGAITTDKILAMSHAIRESMRRSAADSSSPPPNDEDDALQGLSLLSALSSHQYASVGQPNDSQLVDGTVVYPQEEETTSTTSSHLLDEFETPSGPPPAKRLRLEEFEADSKVLRLEEVSSELFPSRDMEPVMEEVVQRVTLRRGRSNVRVKAEDSDQEDEGEEAHEELPHNSLTKTRSSSRLAAKIEPVDVQSEIALARENLEQINRAVDSILGSEADAAAVGSVSPSPPPPPLTSGVVGIRSSPRRSVGNNIRPDFVRTDRVKIVRPATTTPRTRTPGNKSPSSSGRGATAAAKRGANILARSGNNSHRQTQPTPPSPVKPQRSASNASTEKSPEKKTGQKIILMLNKDGQIVSHTEIPQDLVTSVASQQASEDSNSVLMADTVTPTTTTEVDGEHMVIEDIAGGNTVQVYSDNIKSESAYALGDQILEEQVVDTAMVDTVTEAGQVMEQVIYTSDGNTSTVITHDNTSYITQASAGSSDMDAAFGTISMQGVDEQPPQNILEDEELDLESVETILINGQLFKVIRPQKDSVMEVKQETIVVPEQPSASVVVHQEVVQDYEVSSFDQNAGADGVSGSVQLDVVEEHVI